MIQNRETILDMLIKEKESYNIRVDRVGGLFIDAGVEARGGWLAAKAIIELLLDGKGIVQFGELQIGQHRRVTLDIYWDMMPEYWQEIELGKGRQIYLITAPARKDESIAFYSGVTLPDAEILQQFAGEGRILISASPGSLVHHVFLAAKALHTNLGYLTGRGLKEAILWGWGSCPIGSSINETESYALNGAVTSFWVKTEETLISQAVSCFSGYGELRLHSFISGKTFLAGSLNLDKLVLK